MRFESVERRAVRSGEAEIARDRDCREAWLLSVDGTPVSYVDLADPANLPFDVVRRIADVVDALPPGPVRALHVGGATASLARYVHHTRRGSEQLVVDADAELVSLVSGYLPVPVGIEVLAGDGVETVHSERDLDLVVVDGGAMPAEFYDGVEKALAVGGTLIVTERRPALSRLVEVITARFGEPVVIEDQDVLGDAVVVCSTAG